VQLIRQFQKTDDAYRLVVTVKSATGLSPGIFLYLAMPLLPNQTEQEAKFQGVCSPWDLIDAPLNAPDTNADPPWFRYDSVDLILRSTAEADQAWTTITEQVGILLETLERLRVLDGTSEVYELVGFSEQYTVTGI